MGKFAYKVKNAFKSQETREIEAQMAFNKNKRAFAKYYQELDVSIKNFSKMAKDAELGGNHENAKSCALFVLKLQRTQTKVQGLLQRFEMMHSMTRLTGVMTTFVKACADMGYNMDSAIDLKNLWKNTADMDKAIAKLDAMADQMDQVFDTIDSGMNSTGEAIPSQEENDADAERLLNQIMGRHVITNYPEATQQSTAEAEAAQSAPEAADDTDERLRRMMEDLKS